MGLPLKESLLQACRLPRNDDLLMERAKLLGRDDRELIEAVLIRGQSTKSLGHMLGLDARLLRCRVNRVAKRLASRRFLDVARSLPYLSEADAQLARMRFCQGRKLQELCAHFGVSEHTLRRWLDHVEAKVAVICRLSKQTPDGAAQAYREYWDLQKQEA